MSNSKKSLGSGHVIQRRRLLRAGLGLGLGSVVAPGLLTGCSHRAPADQNSGAGDVATGPAVKLGRDLPGVNYPDNYIGPRAREFKPLSGGSKTFTIVVPQDTTVVGDWNKNGHSRWVEEKTGVKVKYLTVNNTDGDMTKVNAMISSGDLPDAFLGISFTRDQVSLYGQQGILQPLDALIGKFAPREQELYRAYPDIQHLAAARDSRTYSLAGVNDCYHCKAQNARTWVNGDFLDKLGMDIPKTTEDLRKILKAMVDQDVNGHGNVVPLVCPMAAPDNDQIDRFFMNSFLYNPSEPWLRLNNGKVEFVANMPEWREGLRYLRSLFDDGSITPELFTMTRESIQKLGGTPGYDRIGVLRNSGPEKFIDIGSNAADARWRKYLPVPPLEGPSGVRNAGWDYYSDVESSLSRFVITSKCKDPATLLQWADYQMDLEATMGSYSGPKSKNWWYAKAGSKSIKGDQAVWKQDVWPAPVGTSWSQYAVMFRSNDFRLGQQIDPKEPTYEANLYQATKQYEPYKQDKSQTLPPVILDPKAAGNAVDTAVSLSNHVKQSLAEFTTAKLDINDDTVWKTYTDKINAMGLQPYLQAYQQAYDNQNR